MSIMLSWLKTRKEAKESNEQKLNRGQNIAGDIFANRKEEIITPRGEFANKILNNGAMGSVNGAKSIQEILAEKAAEQAAQNASTAPKVDDTEINSKIAGIAGNLKNQNLVTEVKCGGSGVNKNVSTSDAEAMVFAATRGVNSSLFKQVEITEAQKKANGSKNFSDGQAESLIDELTSKRANEYSKVEVDAKKFEKQDDNDNIAAYELIGRMTSGLSKSKGEN